MVTSQEILDNELQIEEDLDRYDAQKFHVGDSVTLVDEKMQVVFGKGVHKVTAVVRNIVTICLWHGKRSLNVVDDEIKKLDIDDFSADDVYRAVDIIQDEVITASNLASALKVTYNLSHVVAVNLALAYLHYSL